jgi:hypothetical protein
VVTRHERPQRADVTEARHEAITMGLYISIVLLALLVGFGGDRDRADEVGLLWGTALGLVLAHYYALRLASVFARANPRPTRQDWSAGGAQLAGAAIVTGIASAPYLLNISTDDASTAASILLLGVTAVTAFASVRRAGRGVGRALAFAGIAVTIAAIVVIVKYVLTH